MTPAGSGSYSVKAVDRITGDIIGELINQTGVSTLDYTLSAGLGQSRTYIIDFVITSTSGITGFTPQYSIEENTSGGSSGGVYVTSPASLAPTSQVLVSLQMPKMKVIDFITSVLKMFNIAAYNVDGDIVAIPLDEYYNQGIDYDVSRYVDRSQHTVDRALPYSQINFKYEEPSTFLIKQRNNIVGEEYGNLTYTADDKYDGGSFDVQVNFERMLFERLTDNSSNLTQLQIGWHVDEDQEPNIGKPVIFYSENAPCNVNQIRFSGQPNLSTYNRPQNLDASETLSLNFNAEIDEYSGTVKTNSLFRTYYKTYIENLYNSQTRLYNYTLYLPLWILLNFQLNDRFIINGKRHKINSIKTNLMTGKSEAELIDDIVQPVGLDVPEGTKAIDIRYSPKVAQVLACTASFQVFYYSGSFTFATTTIYADPELTQLAPNGNYSYEGQVATYTGGVWSNLNPC